MAGEAYPIDGSTSSGPPSYTAAEGRQLFSALMLNTTADAFGVRAGRRPGAGMDVTFPTNTTYQVTPGAYIAYPRFNATQGPYLCQFGSNETGSVNAAHATLPRKDILYVIVDDNPVDGSGARQARILYLPGTAASTPSAPAVPARGNLLATITVPASGGGSPTKAMGPMGVGAGGVLPVVDSTDRLSLTGYAGLVVHEVTTGRLYNHNGSAWLGVTVGNGAVTVSGSSVLTTNVSGDFTISYGMSFTSTPNVTAMSGDHNAFNGWFAQIFASTNGNGWSGRAMTVGSGAAVPVPSATMRVNWDANGPI